jgi:glutamate decarboxylase
MAGVPVNIKVQSLEILLWGRIKKGRLPLASLFLSLDKFEKMSTYELDEGIERLEYQFDYGIGSGKQTYSEKTQFITDFANKRRGSISSPTGVKETYRDQDSILHYFIPTTESEFLLDSYIQKLINTFLTSNNSINTIENKTQNDTNSHEVTDHVEIKDYMRHLKENVDKSTRTNAPEMIGHMTTALPYFHRPLSKLLTTLNQNVVKVETSSTFTSLERQTLAIMHSVFYKNTTEFYGRYSDNNMTALGMVCSGGTIANISALWIARNKALGSKGDFKGVVKEGLVQALKYYKYSRAVVIGSKLMHYSFKKATDLLGLGEDELILIDCDQEYRMRVDVLELEIKRLQKENVLILAVVAVAGTTETGSIDPLTKIGKLCKLNGIHFHIDAAWGGIFY